MNWMGCVRRVCWTLFLLYLCELGCRLMAVKPDWIPSALLAWAASRVFLACASVSYGCLDLIRRGWEFLLRLKLWRQMLDSLGIFSRGLEFLLSPLGLLFGAIRYVTWRLGEWGTSRAVPIEVSELLANINSLREWLSSYFRFELSRYYLMPSLYCCALCLLVTGLAWRNRDLFSFCWKRWLLRKSVEVPSSQRAKPAPKSQQS